MKKYESAFNKDSNAFKFDKVQSRSIPLSSWVIRRDRITRNTLYLQKKVRRKENSFLCFMRMVFVS